MSGFVYLWYDRKHKRFYIGSHWGLPTDGYICSSRWMRAAYKNRPTDFRRKILKFASTQHELLREEERWLRMIKPEELGDKYYNLKRGHVGHWSADTEYAKKSIKEKISEKTKAAMQRPEVREKYEAGLKTRKTPHANTAWREQIRQTCLSKNLNKGMLTVRYPHEDKCFHISTDDPRWLNGEVVTAKGHKRNPRKRNGHVTGERHHMFSGYYHTPWGKFTSAGEAASSCPLGTIHEDVIWKWCKQNSNQVFNQFGRPPQILQKEWIGKSRQEVGFFFEKVKS